MAGAGSREWDLERADFLAGERQGGAQLLHFLLTALGCEVNDEGWVATDRTGRTSIDGVWAPGNVVDHTAQLINVADGYQLWSERYDREMQDIFEIQDDISQAIVKALRVILSDDEKKQIELPRAASVEAYDFYLRGRQHFHQLRRSSLE